MGGKDGDHFLVGLSSRRRREDTNLVFPVSDFQYLLITGARLNFDFQAYGFCGTHLILSCKLIQ